MHDAVHRALDAGRARRPRQRPVAARHDRGRRPARPARDRTRDRLWIVRQQRRGACSATRRSRSSTRRPSTPAPAVRAVLERAPDALVAVEERGVGYRVNRRLPGRRALRRDDPHRRSTTWSPRPVSRVIIRDPRRDRRRLRRARRASSACTAPTTSSAGPPGSTSRRSGVSKASGLEYVAERARPRPRPTCSRSATAATTSRCSSGRAAASRWGRPIEEVIDAADDVTGDGRRGRRRGRARPVVLSRAALPGWSRPTSTARWCAPTAPCRRTPTRSSPRVEELGVPSSS